MTLFEFFYMGTAAQAVVVSVAGLIAIAYVLYSIGIAVALPFLIRRGVRTLNVFVGFSAFFGAFLLVALVGVSVFLII